MSCAAVDAELRFDLAQRALGAVERQLQLARLEPDEHVAGPDLGAELHADFADDAGDLAADLGLSGDISVPGEVDLALHRHPLDVRGLGRHGGAAAAATPAAALAPAARLARSCSRQAAAVAESAAITMKRLCTF